MLREPGLRRWEGSKVGNNFLSVPREGFHFLEPRRVASGTRTRTGWPIATAPATGLGDPRRDGRAAHSKARKGSYFHFCSVGWQKALMVVVQETYVHGVSTRSTRK